MYNVSVMKVVIMSISTFISHIGMLCSESLANLSSEFCEQQLKV